LEDISVYINKYDAPSRLAGHRVRLNHKKEVTMRKWPFARVLSLAVLTVAFTAALAFADTIVMKDGKVVQGTLKGAGETTIMVDVGGKIQEIAINDIASFTFAPRGAKSAAAPATPATGATPATPATGATPATPAAGAAAATAAPPATAKTGPATLAAGTTLMLKTQDPVSTASHKKGTKFTTVLENDLVADGSVVVPKGTVVYGTVVSSRGGKVVGGASLVVTFTQMSINNQPIAIVTDEAGAETAPGGAAKKVGAGALVGAAAGDTGAGAAVGGALALMTAKGNHLQVPAGTVVQVTLKQPVQIP
jgi:hypothetical protein